MCSPVPWPPYGAALVVRAPIAGFAARIVAWWTSRARDFATAHNSWTSWPSAAPTTGACPRGRRSGSLAKGRAHGRAHGTKGVEAGDAQGIGAVRPGLGDDPGRRLRGQIRPSGGRRAGRRCAFPGREWRDHERPALCPGQRHAPNAGARRPGGARLHQFARDPGRLRHRVRQAGLCRAGPGPEGAWLFRSAGVRRGLRRAGGAGLSAIPVHGRSGQYRPGGPQHGRLDRAGGRQGCAQRLQGHGAGGLLHRLGLRRGGRPGVAAEPGCGVQPVRRVLQADVGRRPGP